jgi:hypothetical protein
MQGEGVRLEPWHGQSGLHRTAFFINLQDNVLSGLSRVPRDASMHCDAVCPELRGGQT